MTDALRFEVVLHDECATRALGREIAGLLRPGDVVILTGALGAGKTTLVKGLVAALDDTIEVTSPTFALCHRYESEPPIAHVDCWRMEHASEVADLALDELLDEGWVAIIEWGERLGGLFDSAALIVSLERDEDARSAALTSSSARWRKDSDALSEIVRHLGGDPC